MFVRLYVQNTNEKNWINANHVPNAILMPRLTSCDKWQPIKRKKSGPVLRFLAGFPCRPLLCQHQLPHVLSKFISIKFCYICSVKHVSVTVMMTNNALISWLVTMPSWDKGCIQVFRTLIVSILKRTNFGWASNVNHVWALGRSCLFEL